MRQGRTLRWAAVVAGLTACMAMMPSAAFAAPNASASQSKTYPVSVESSQPIPQGITVDELERQQAAGKIKVAGLRGSSPNLITTQAATPGGFKLQAPGVRKSDYVYNSDTVVHNSLDCPVAGGACSLGAQVNVQLYQQALGGSSHTWSLKLNMSQKSNPKGYSWSYFATYYCGVNIANADDEECSNGAAPSGVSMSQNTSVYKPWGSTNNITTFPMVAATTSFSNGAVVVTRFRGWDTLSRATTTKLAANSGTGS